MGSGGRRHRSRHHSDDGKSYNLLSIILCAVVTITGIAMISIGKQFSLDCKMESIDESNYEDFEAPGNLPKWFVYSGTLYIVTGVWSFATQGLLPNFCRSRIPLCGHCCADTIQGICGLLVSLYAIVVLIACNFIGSLFLAAAKLGRTTFDSDEPGDPNYCHPAVWNTALFITRAFWVAFAVVIFSAVAKFYKFLVGGGKADLSAPRDKINV